MATVEKRPLTEEELAEANRLRAAWLRYRDAHKGATQAWLGSVTELGSQGLIGQYMRGIIPLNLRALLAMCSVIDAAPEEISPRLMKWAKSTPLLGELRTQGPSITADSEKSEPEKNPGRQSVSTGLNTPFSQKLAAFKDELARAEREGILTVQKVDLLLGVLRLNNRAPGRPRHTTKKILDEGVPGQSRGRIKRKRSG
jgi:hypothetical protein